MTCEIYLDPDEWVGEEVLDLMCAVHGLLKTFYGRTAFNEIQAEAVLHQAEYTR